MSLDTDRVRRLRTGMANGVLSFPPPGFHTDGSLDRPASLPQSPLSRP